MAFSKFKKRRGKGVEQLQERFNKLDQKSENGPDERFWKPTRDKSGNGYAVVRFMPEPDGEDEAFVRYWDHFFKGPSGMWYAEKSLTTLNQDDPMSEQNKIYYANEATRHLASRYKRRLHYVCNIYVIEDPANREAEGKVFLYDYGKMISDKIKDAANPRFPDVAPLDAFDLFDGANFVFRIRSEVVTINGVQRSVPKYDDCGFQSPSVFLDGDEKAMEAAWKQCYPLQPFIDPDSFKSYQELETRMYRALNLDGGMAHAPSAPPKSQPTAAARRGEERGAPSPAEASPATPPWEEDLDHGADDGDEDLAFFKSLGQQ